MIGPIKYDPLTDGVRTRCVICGYAPPLFEIAQGLGLDRAGHCQTCTTDAERWHEPEVETCHFCTKTHPDMARVDGGLLACLACRESCPYCETPTRWTQFAPHEPANSREIPMIDGCVGVCDRHYASEVLGIPSEPERRDPPFPDTDIGF